MVKQVKLLTVVIVFAQARQKATAIALDPQISKETGSQIQIPQTIYRGANGSAEEANQ